MFSAQTHLVAEPIQFLPFLWLLLWRFPLITWMVQLRIHWQALLLLWKGAALFPNPNPASNDNCTTRAIEAVALPVVWLLTAVGLMDGGSGGQGSNGKERAKREVEGVTA